MATPLAESVMPSLLVRAALVAVPIAAVGACFLDDDFRRKPCQADVECDPGLACRVIEPELALCDRTQGCVCVRICQPLDARSCTGSYTWEADIKAIVNSRCAICHTEPRKSVIGGTLPPENFRLDRFEDTSVVPDGGSPDAAVTIEGAQSMARTAADRASSCLAPMPPAPLPPLSVEDQCKLIRWAAAGAPRTADGGAAPRPDAGPCLNPASVTLTSLQTNIFTDNCACHGDLDPQQGMKLLPGQTYGMTVNRPSNEAPTLDRIEPRDPSASYLMLKVIGQHVLVPGGQGARMPWGGPYLSEAQLAQIHDWICLGAPNN